MNLDPRDILFELGRRQIIAGQEDFILEVAINLARRTGTIPRQRTPAR
jgi:4-hydroxy 2-oxovalerate aldolase